MNIAATSMGRTQRLRTETAPAHERLDSRIMAANPFAGRGRYGRFLQVQYLFHREIDALYNDSSLTGLLPDLPGRRRLGQIAQDLQDLGLAIPPDETKPAFDGDNVDVDVAAALGWLYVAEGSNLGAAFLLKEAAKLDLNEQFGARHLSAHPQGRGLHWRTFTAALDAIVLSDEDDARAVAGAVRAFERVRALVEQYLPVDEREPAAKSSTLS